MILNPPEGPYPWEHPGHQETQHRDRKLPWCSKCGWRAPRPARPAIPAVQVKKMDP